MNLEKEKYIVTWKWGDRLHKIVIVGETLKSIYISALHTSGAEKITANPYTEKRKYLKRKKE